MGTKEEAPLVNRVANSALITLNPEDFVLQGERVLMDIKEQLFQGLILREKDFRQFVREHDWSQYEGKYVALTCSVDAIVPAWAYMLLTIHLEPYAKEVIYGTLDDLERVLTRQALDAVDFSQYTDQRIVVKGCGGIHTETYVEFARRLRPFAKTIMYGEPCSTVPLYKKKS